jgi:hypothetical protein
MSTQRQVQAQTLVILGFVVSAVSGVISYFETVTTRGYEFSSLREIVIPMLNPLTMIAPVFAWWWLARIEAGDEGQRTILQRAFVAFAIQYVCTTALVLFLVTPFRSLGGFWLTCVFWFELVGALVSALGLFLLSRTFSARAQMDQPVTEADAVS